MQPVTITRDWNKWKFWKLDQLLLIILHKNVPKLVIILKVYTRVSSAWQRNLSYWILGVLFQRKLKEFGVKFPLEIYVILRKFNTFQTYLSINVILAGLSEYEHLFVLSGPQIIKPYLTEYQDPNPIFN